MKNEYSINEKESLVAIICHYPGEPISETAYVDLDIFNQIKDRDLFWRLYQASGKPYVAAHDQSIGRIVNLKKLVGDIAYGGAGNNYSLVNKKYNDLRKCNIIHYANGCHSNPDTQARMQEMLDVQPKLPTMDGNDWERSNKMEDTKKEAVIAENNDTLSTPAKPRIDLVKIKGKFSFTINGEANEEYTKEQMDEIHNLIHQNSNWFAL